jgi:Uma2 family endonuclease
MVTDPTRLRRWTRAEYERLIEAGIPQPGEAVELPGGELIVSEPRGSAHYTSVGLIEDALRAALGPGWLIRSQGPIALIDDSEPEPDVAVTHGTRRDYREEHPSRAAVVVEVAESSLALHREHKGSLYARTGVADYWILNLADRVLEIPRAAPGSGRIVRLALRVDQGAVLRIVRHPAGRAGRADPDGGPPAVAPHPGPLPRPDASSP